MTRRLTLEQYPVEHGDQCPRVRRPVGVVEPAREGEQARGELGELSQEGSEGEEEDADDERAEFEQSGERKSV